MGAAKRRVNFQLTIAACAFAFSAIILGIGVAMYNGDLRSDDNGAYIAGAVFAIFEFGCCIAMLALWISLYNSLKSADVVRRLLSSSLVVFSLILAYIACVVIVDVINVAGLMYGYEKGYMDAVGWEAINGLVVAFTSIGLIVSIISCVAVHAAAKRIDAAKQMIKDRFFGNKDQQEVQE